MDEHEKLMPTIPYIAYESAQARSERVVKRLITALIFVIVLMFATNAIWVYEWMSYDYVVGDEITLDSGNNGNANYIGNNGEITNNGNDNSSVLP